jgi:multicomponent Na+:H+ antiporter subunit G
MNTLLSVASVLLISLGVVFFIAGTLGVLRFDSTLNRLHALTKADNLGLGLVVLGLMLQATSWAVAFKYFFIWVLVMISAAMLSQLIGQRAAKQQDKSPNKQTQPPDEDNATL